MPWKETCVMDEKTAFIAECLRGELPMTALCERYGIAAIPATGCWDAIGKRGLVGWSHARARRTGMA